MRHQISFKVNGQNYALEVHSHDVLLDVIRNDLNLTGAKEGCLAGTCGACTVLLNGVSVNACMVLAVEADGCEIVTVEGLGDSDQLHPLQKAFVEKGAVQCGFCTSGMILSAKTFLENNHRPSLEEARKSIRGHICRCTGYKKIEEAIMSAADEMREDRQ